MNTYTQRLKMSSDLYIRDAVVPISRKISLDFQVQADRLQQLSLAFKFPIFVSGSESKSITTVPKMMNKKHGMRVNSICGRSHFWLRPVHLEVGQFHDHFIHNRRDCSVAFGRLLDETVLYRQEAKISNNDVWRGGRLGEENHRCVEVDVKSNSSASLCQLLHTRGCLFCSLNRHLSEGFFRLVEIINEYLKGRISGE